ncbi:FUSC family protein [Synechococcus sp. UW140]|uniref:FUSC family protein n=1 Tax=Synechococcus sp. UW140 TaxID=368503 RepID=UPI000E0F5CFC|nr:FUSC family protein [Synechococcus sp. UW140]
MATEQQWLGLRAALAIGLAASLTHQVCLTLGLGDIPAAYGVVVGVLVVRPDFCRWPVLIYPVLMVIAGLSMVIGLSVRLMFPAGPEVWWFGVVGVLMQLLAVALPAKLALLTNVVAAAGVLPLLDPAATWTDWGHQLEAVAIGLAIGTALQWGLTPSGYGAPAPPSGPEGDDLPMPQRYRLALSSWSFWRKLVLTAFALTIGVGLGTQTPKYLYFGVVLLLNDSIGATLARVRDRMVGMSLGVLMPLLVFNTIGLNSVAVALAMGGTAAFVAALNLGPYLRTALISSGVAFAGYGPLVSWYIPNRWIDYLLGCALALLSGLLLFPDSALSRYRQLLERSDPSAREELARLYPAAREEASWLGQRLPTPP